MADERTWNNGTTWAVVLIVIAGLGLMAYALTGTYGSNTGSAMGGPYQANPDMNPANVPTTDNSATGSYGTGSANGAAATTNTGGTSTDMGNGTTGNTGTGTTTTGNTGGY